MNPARIRYPLCVLLLFFFIACNNSGNNNDNVVADTIKLLVKPDTPKTVEQKKSEQNTSKTVPATDNNTGILDTLNTLPFVIESNKFLDSVTGHKSALAYIIDTLSDKYSIRAGYNGEEGFETYYFFVVDKITRVIKVEDVISGELLTPEAFDKRRKSKQ